MTECEHVDKNGLTTTYKVGGSGKKPIATCDNCGKQLTPEQFLERVNYVAKCHSEGKPYV